MILCFFDNLCSQYCLCYSLCACHLQCVIVMYEQNTRVSRNAAVNDGQADWLDVQTLYTSGRFADQPGSSPPVVRECLSVFFSLFCFLFVTIMN